MSRGPEPMQLFDPLPAHIEDALAASIERFGVLVPVVTDQHGTVLDGHHRKTIADRLKVKYRVDVITVAGDSEAREIARTLNSDRRQLSEDQRREVAAELRQQGHSLRAIGGALGVSDGTIRKDLAAEELRTGTQLAPERVMGLDGKSRPARRPVIIAAKHEREAARIREPLADVLEAQDAGPGDSDDARKINATLRRGVLNARDVRDLRRPAARINRPKVDPPAITGWDDRVWERQQVDVTLADELRQLAGRLPYTVPKRNRRRDYPGQAQYVFPLLLGAFDQGKITKLKQAAAGHPPVLRALEAVDDAAADYERSIADALAACDAAAERTREALETAAEDLLHVADDAPAIITGQHERLTGRRAERFALTDADRQALAPLLGSSLPPDLLAAIDSKDEPA